MKKHDIDAVTRALAPTTTPTISQDAWTELSDAITATEAAPAVEKKRAPARPRLVLVAAASLLIVGVIAAAFVNRPGQDQPQALSVTEMGDKLIVRVIDPTADPKRYNAEFKKLGLNIKVAAVAVSPPFVGRMLSFSGRNAQDMARLHRLEPGEKCNGTLNASDPGCQDGVEVAKNFDGESEIQFGRAAKPGEMYWHTSSSATEPGESLAGLKIHNKTVAEVLPMIEARGIKVVSYLSGNPPQLDSKDSAPGDWYVDDATPFAPGEVNLSVGPAPGK
jgi:hypothetical protein